MFRYGSYRVSITVFHHFSKLRVPNMLYCTLNGSFGYYATKDPHHTISGERAAPDSCRRNDIFRLLVETNVLGFTWASTVRLLKYEPWDLECNYHEV